MSETTHPLVNVAIVFCIVALVTIGYYAGRYNQWREDEMRESIRRRNQIALREAARSKHNNNNNRRK